MLDKKFAIHFGFFGKTVELVLSSPKNSGCEDNLTGKLWRGGCYRRLSTSFGFFSTGKSVMTGHSRSLKATWLHPVSGYISLSQQKLIPRMVWLVLFAWQSWHMAITAIMVDDLLFRALFVQYLTNYATNVRL